MRAILSVYDKTGIAGFARGLHGLGWEIFSTGGTQRAIEAAGVPVASVAQLTGSPEMLGGRVKTLHPLVHGALLYRRGHAEDEADVAAHGIHPVDLVAGNLYPFVETVTGDSVTLAEALEQIDIGGPTMIRAAAKNHPWVIPLVSPEDYTWVLEALREGGAEALDGGARRALAAKAFAHVSHYDAMVAEYLRGEEGEGGLPFPEQLTVGMTRIEQLRYGENPHQRGAFYRLDSVRTPVAGIGAYEQHHGKALSFVNILDADAAYNAVADFEEPALAIVKHTNPCCFAAGDDAGGMAALYERALREGDYLSAYGGIVATNRPIDMAYAQALREVLSPESGVRMFYEIVIAPGADPDALEHLKKKSKDLRILTAPLGAPRTARKSRRGGGARGGRLRGDALRGGEPAPSHGGRVRRPAHRMAGLQAREVECRGLREGRCDGRYGRGAAKPRRQRSTLGRGRRRAGARRRGRHGRADPLPGHRGGLRAIRRDLRDAHRRLDPRRGLGGRRQPPRHLAAHDGRAPLPPLSR